MRDLEVMFMLETAYSLLRRRVEHRRRENVPVFRTELLSNDHQSVSDEEREAAHKRKSDQFHDVNPWPISLAQIAKRERSLRAPCFDPMKHICEAGRPRSRSDEANQLMQTWPDAIAI